MQSMAQGWLALELTNNPFLVTLVASIGSLPVLLLSLHAGVVVDRTDKLRLVTAMQALLLIEASVLWWFTWTGRISYPILLALAAAAGTVSAFEIPARQAMMIELVGREDLHAAIALNSSGFNLARVLGPSVGAAVIASAGLAWCFALNALSYLAVLAGLTRIRRPAWQPPVYTTSPWEGMRQGLVYMTRTPEVRVLMTVVAVYSICGTPYLTLMPVVARDVLHGGAGAYGVLLACVGVGGLAGALFLAAVAHRVRRGRFLAGSAYAYGALLVAFALCRSAWLAAPVLLLTGCMMILNSALANGLLQSIVPDAMRGRLMSAYSFVVVGLSAVVGNAVAGRIAQWVGADGAIGALAAVMLTFAAWTFARHPEVVAL
jgi:MFS family permease